MKRYSRLTTRCTSISSCKQRREQEDRLRLLSIPRRRCWQRSSHVILHSDAEHVRDAPSCNACRHARMGWLALPAAAAGHCSRDTGSRRPIGSKQRRRGCQSCQLFASSGGIRVTVPVARIAGTAMARHATGRKLQLAWQHIEIC